MGWNDRIADPDDWESYAEDIKEAADLRRKEMREDAAERAEDRRQFEAYEQVRQSGVTNMFDVNTVCALSGLTRNEVLFVQKHYGKLAEQFQEVAR